MRPRPVTLLLLSPRHRHASSKSFIGCLDHEHQDALDQKKFHSCFYGGQQLSRLATKVHYDYITYRSTWLQIMEVETCCSSPKNSPIVDIIFLNRFASVDAKFLEHKLKLVMCMFDTVETVSSAEQRSVPDLLLNIVNLCLTTSHVSLESLQ